jgi:CarD family transcriptional regulator
VRSSVGMSRGISDTADAERTGHQLFSVGDSAVYPSQGIGQIVGIEEREIHGKVCSFYLLEVASSGLRILVPVDKASHVGLRPVANPADIDEVLAILREERPPSERRGPSWNRRYRGFVDKIKSGSLFEIAEVLRDLHHLRKQKTLSFGERRMMDTARSLLVQELSASRLVDEGAAGAELDGALSRPAV